MCGVRGRVFRINAAPARIPLITRRRRGARPARRAPRVPPALNAYGRAPRHAPRTPRSPLAGERRVLNTVFPVFDRPKTAGVARDPRRSSAHSRGCARAAYRRPRVVDIRVVVIIFDNEYDHAAITTHQEQDRCAPVVARVVCGNNRIAIRARVPAETRHCIPLFGAVYSYRPVRGTRSPAHCRVSPLRPAGNAPRAIPYLHAGLSVRSGSRGCRVAGTVRENYEQK